LIGWECNTRVVIQIMGIIVAGVAATMFYPIGSTVNHFYDAYYTSNYHTICAPNKLFDSGETTSQGISNGAMCLTVAKPAVWLVFFTGLIQTVYGTGSM
jgi:hypothetical protein